MPPTLRSDHHDVARNQSQAARSPWPRAPCHGSSDVDAVEAGDGRSHSRAGDTVRKATPRWRRGRRYGHTVGELREATLGLRSRQGVGRAVDYDAESPPDATTLPTTGGRHRRLPHPGSRASASKGGRIDCNSRRSW